MWDTMSLNTIEMGLEYDERKPISGLSMMGYKLFHSLLFFYKAIDRQQRHTKKKQQPAN
jgi:hypothetical protein